MLVPDWSLFAESFFIVNLLRSSVNYCWFLLNYFNVKESTTYTTTFIRVTYSMTFIVKEEWFNDREERRFSIWCLLFIRFNKLTVHVAHTRSIYLCITWHDIRHSEACESDIWYYIKQTIIMKLKYKMFETGSVSLPGVKGQIGGAHTDTLR